MSEVYDGVEFYKGFPKQQGWYDCLVEGEYKRLQHWVCIMNGRHRWKRHDGSYETGSVLWTGEAEARE